MKNLNEKVVSLLLSGALVTSVAPMAVSASKPGDSDPINYYIIDSEEMYVKTYELSGVYTALINGEPVYVYLGNGLTNKYVYKEEALYIGELNYEKTYVFSKKVNNPSYIAGVSESSERYITVYALSDKTRVNGWTRINKNEIGSEDFVATTIELGEFVLKQVDLTAYYFNMLGFGYADLNKDDQYNEIVYFGNNKVNRLMTKEEAIKFGVNTYENYYVLKKTIDNPAYVKGVNNPKMTVYTISEKSYVNGWTRIKKSELPDDATVSSNPEYILALADMRKAKHTEKDLYMPSFGYNYLVKSEALAYAYNNYQNFCILTKTIVNPNDEDDKKVMYAFSFQYPVEGWQIIGNDYIPENACIFLTMDDAYNYEDQLNYSYSLKLN